MLRIALLIYRLTLITRNFRVINRWLRFLANRGYTVGVTVEQGWSVYPLPMNMPAAESDPEQPVSL